MDSPLTIAYIEAYKLLEDQDDKEPLVKFSAIVDSYPDAHLAAYQQRRLRQGETGIQIDLC